MEQRVHLYVSRKQFITWITAVMMAASALYRTVLQITCYGTQDIWSYYVLPMIATVYFICTILLNGEECFYKTAFSTFLMAVASGIRTSTYSHNRATTWLIWIALAFLCIVYTEITAGGKRKFVWTLLPILLVTGATVLIFYKQSLIPWNWEVMKKVIPDLTVILGAAVLTLGIRVHPAGEYHMTWGDRSDGRRIRSLAPMDQVSPYIMVNRNGSSNHFFESFEITNVDRYIRQKRKEGLTNFGIMHVFLACYCRCLAKYPALNRFIAGQKVYTHGEDIQFCLTIKKEMSTKSPETIVKVHLSPRDTAEDVYRKLNAEVESAKNSPLDSSFDNTANVFMMIPGVGLKFMVWLLKTLDYFGLLPKFLLEVSPFHGSIFFTSMGSLGIPPIYHHLYDFGNLPVFCAFGCKQRRTEVLEDGTVVNRKYVDFRVTMDERICDGYYYAAFFKHFKRVIAHPEVLDNPPEEVIADID